MKQLKTALNSLFTPEAAPRSTKAPTQEYVATYFDASGNRLLTHTGMPKYARQSLTAAAHHRIMAADAKHLIGVFRAELTLRTFPDCKEVHTLHFVYRGGEFSHVDAKPEVAADKGIDINAADRDNKAISKLAVKDPSWKAAVKKSSRVKKVKLLPAKKATKTVAAKKAATPGQPSDAMLRELMACHAGKPTQDKLGSCMRMHLKMRGLVSDMKAGTLTADGQKLAKSHVSGKVQKQPK